MRKTISAVFASQRFSSDTRDILARQPIVATQRRDKNYYNYLFFRLMEWKEKV